MDQYAMEDYQTLTILSKTSEKNLVMPFMQLFHYEKLKFNLHYILNLCSFDFDHFLRHLSFTSPRLPSFITLQTYSTNLLQDEAILILYNVPSMTATAFMTLQISKPSYVQSMWNM